MNIACIYCFKGQIIKNNRLCLNCVENWNDGEVRWEEEKKATQFSDETIKPIVNATFHEQVIVPIKKIKPTIYTVYTEFVKKIYKDLFGVDTIVDVFQKFDTNNFALHKFDINFDLYCAFITYGILYRVGGVKKFRDFYHTSYISRKTRRNIQKTVAIGTLTIMIILTKGIQNAV